jgi:MFS family permease
MDNTMPVVETTATGVWISKGALGASGILGSLAVASMWLPKRLKDRHPMVAGGLMCGFGVLGSIGLGGLVIHYLGLDKDSLDVAMGIGVISGACSAVLINSFVNFVEKNENKDTLELVSMVRNAVKSEPKPKPAAKKVVRKARAGVKK